MPQPVQRSPSWRSCTSARRHIRYCPVHTGSASGTASQKTRSGSPDSSPTSGFLPCHSASSASLQVRQTASASHPHVSRPAGTGSSRPDHAENPAQNCSVRQIPYGISYRCRRLFCRSRAVSLHPRPDTPPAQTHLLPGDIRR